MNDLTPDDTARRSNTPPLQGRGKGWGLSANTVASLHAHARTMRNVLPTPKMPIFQSFVFIIASLQVSSCSTFTAKNPISEANALSGVAEKCLLDTRDKGLKYEKSTNCKMLGSVSQAYINAGGQLPGEPTESKLVAEQAIRMAWTAKAISASSDPAISLW